MAKYCSYCGTQIEEDARFCSRCGKPEVDVKRRQTVTPEGRSTGGIRRAPSSGIGKFLAGGVIGAFLGRFFGGGSHTASASAYTASVEHFHESIAHYRDEDDDYDDYGDDERDEYSADDDDYSADEYDVPDSFDDSYDDYED